MAPQEGRGNPEPKTRTWTIGCRVRRRPYGTDSGFKHEKRIPRGIKDSIEVAQKLECSTLLVTTGNEIVGVPRKTQHENIVESLREAAELAENADITLVSEPLNILVDHKGYYLHSSGEGFDILREVDSPNVKLLYDIYHQEITEGNLIDPITKIIDLIGHFHVGDVPGRHEPGTGEINYASVFRK
jgi:hydroxypyruvate isomerase